MPEYRTQPAKGPGELVTGGLLKGHDRAMEDVAEAMLKAAPGRVRFVLKRLPGAPGLVYDAASLAASKDKARTPVGMVGGTVGAMAGGALGAAAGGVGAPIGAAVGGGAGDEIATEFYDDHKDAIQRQIAATKRWIADREAYLTGGR